nr:LysR substrate-binding domain-containing protein [Marinobacter sp. SS8-8]
MGYSNFTTGNDWPFEGLQGPAGVRVRPWMYANNGETCCAAAVAGQGVALQPGFLVRKDLEAGRLVELMSGYRSARLGVYAVYPTRKFVTPKVRALVDYLASAFPEAL